MTAQNAALKLFGGVDLHKEKFHVHIMDQNEKTRDSKNLLSQEKHIREYFRGYTGLDMEVAVEIGNSTFWFCDIVNSMGIKTYVVNTLENRSISRSKIKTDKGDAKSLANGLRCNYLPKRIYIPSELQRQIRSLIAQRDQYVRNRTQLTNRVHSFLSRSGIVIQKSRMRKSTKYWEELFSQLVDASHFLRNTLSRYFQDYKNYVARINEIEYDLHQLIKENYMEEYKLLLTIPGIGPLTAYAFLGVVGDWKRFKSGRQLCAYLGLVPSFRESGDKQVKGHGRITKKGHRLLRGYLVQAALSILCRFACERNKKPFQEWYEEVKKRRGWKKARIALARKICNTVFGVLKSGKKFDPLLITKNSKTSQ